MTQCLRAESTNVPRPRLHFLLPSLSGVISVTLPVTGFTEVLDSSLQGSCDCSDIVLLNSFGFLYSHTVDTSLNTLRETEKDREAWRAAAQGVAKART